MPLASRLQDGAQNAINKGKYPEISCSVKAVLYLFFILSFQEILLKHGLRRKQYEL